MPDGPAGPGAPADGSDGGGGPAQPPAPPEPAGGELGWLVSTPGAGDPVSVTVDRSGDIIVVASQTGAVRLGSLELPTPTGAALLVMKLNGRGEPIWGRSFVTGGQLSGPAVATTAEGDLVVGGTFWGGSLQVGDQTIANAGGYDSFVIMLDGASGGPRWMKEIGTTGDDRLAGIAVGRDASGAEAIYLHGGVAAGVVIDGQLLPGGGYLMRYDVDGSRRWSVSFAGLEAEYDDALVLDPQRGPVIAGRIGAGLTLGDQTLPAGAVVAGFDPDGHLRFARSLRSRFTAYHHNLAVAPNGDIYVGSDTEGRPTVLDGHVISNPSSERDLFLLRLTADGRYAHSTVFAGETFASPQHVTTDADGAVYMLGNCGGKTEVEPEITCGLHGNVLVSYDADNTPRWSTSFEPAFAEAAAPAPDHRLIVVGEALADQIRIGGATMASQRLFIASLGAGPARLPQPLPDAPAISRVALDGASDHEIRQGGTGTLVIDGHGLDHVTSAQLGDIDVHLPPNAGTPAQLRLPVRIPHGHAQGPLPLVLRTAGGRTRVEDIVTVTPIVAGVVAIDSGRGTFASPMSLCDAQRTGNVSYGDLLYVLDGRHGCGVGPPRGVTARGQSMTGTIVTSAGASDDGFDPAVIENLTVDADDYSAINVLFGGELTITNVIVRNRSGSGIWIDGGATATVTHYRYDSSAGTALVIANGQVTATDVTAGNAYRGVILAYGTLDLKNADLSSDGPAIDAGDLNTNGGSRRLTIAGSTLRSTRVALTEAFAEVTVTDTLFERSTENPARFATGIQLFGGTLTLTRSTVHGWDKAGISADQVEDVPQSEAIVRATLDQVDVDAGDTGIDYYYAAYHSQLSVRNSHVVGHRRGIVISDGFDAIDLGTAASPGNNRIDNPSGGPALEDIRATAGAAVDAHGTALNGTSFDGEVLGPLSVPGAYTINGPNTIRF